MDTLEQLQREVHVFGQDSHQTSGLIRDCCRYLQQLAATLALPNLSWGTWQTLHAAKDRLHQRLYRRLRHQQPCTRPMVVCLLQTETFTLRALALWQPFTQHYPPLDWYLDWREVCRRPDKRHPVYLTDPGARTWIWQQLARPAFGPPLMGPSPNL